MDQLAGHDPEPERTLLRRLQENGLMVRFRSAIENVGQELVPQHDAWRIPLLLLRLLTMATFRLAVTGRVPGLSGRYRWFLRQPHLAPEMSGSFVRFALRLTAGERHRGVARVRAPGGARPRRQPGRRPVRGLPRESLRHRRRVVHLDRQRMRRHLRRHVHPVRPGRRHHPPGRAGDHRPEPAGRAAARGTRGPAVRHAGRLRGPDFVQRRHPGGR